MLVLTVTRLIDVDQAFAILRDQARNRNQRLSDLVRAFLDGTAAMTSPASGSPRTSRSSTRRHRRSLVAGRLVVTMLSCRPLEVTSAPLADVTAHPPFLPDGGGARR